MNKNIIGMASDHAGFEMKEAIKSRLEKAGYEVKDFGTCLLIFILMLILSLLIIFNPMKAVLNINQSMGMIIIFYSILDVIMCYLFRNNIN